MIVQFANVKVNADQKILLTVLKMIEETPVHVLNALVDVNKVIVEITMVVQFVNAKANADQKILTTELKMIGEIHALDLNALADVNKAIAEIIMVVLFVNANQDVHLSSVSCTANMDMSRTLMGVNLVLAKMIVTAKKCHHVPQWLVACSAQVDMRGMNKTVKYAVVNPHPILAVNLFNVPMIAPKDSAKMYSVVTPVSVRRVKLYPSLNPNALPSIATCHALMASEKTTVGVMCATAVCQKEESVPGMIAVTCLARMVS